jgi:hypothetical protein
VLIAAWNDLGGEDIERTEAWKLRGRMERIVWEPPELSFDLERHGSVALGGTRADVHRWSVNIERRDASVVQMPPRQVKPADARLDVGKLALEIANLIANEVDDDRLRWRDDPTVSES